MRGNELIAMMRHRLGDGSKEWWSDDELKDNINFSLSAIAHKLLPWKGRWVSATTIGVDTYSIPEDFMAPISLIYNDTLIPINGIEWSLSQNSSEGMCAFIDNDALVFSPMPSEIKTFALNYHALWKIESTGDVLHLSDELIDTVLYYALSLSFQKQANEQSLTQSKYYLDLYKDRCHDVAKISHQRRGITTVKSKFQKV